MDVSGLSGFYLFLNSKRRPNNANAIMNVGEENLSYSRDEIDESAINFTMPITRTPRKKIVLVFVLPIFIIFRPVLRWFHLPALPEFYSPED